MPFLIIQILD